MFFVREDLSKPYSLFNIFIGFPPFNECMFQIQIRFITIKMVDHSCMSIIALILVVLTGRCVSFPRLNSKLLTVEKRSLLYPYQKPGPNDIRGPCPGLNTAANHGYINRNGITDFNQLVQAQQNLYNVAPDLAIALATAGVLLDGDIRTGKLSIGKNSSAVPGILNTPGGLNYHGTFEGDTSLTRNDYYLAKGDDYTFNGTLYGMMHSFAQQNGGLYNRKAMADYRYERYQQSLRDNGLFLFPPQSVLIYGAASFLYELFPSATDNAPTETVISSFFGAQPDGRGHWTSIPERIPPNWVKRKTPYTLVDVAVEILKLYIAHPVPFGGNTGEPNTFFPLPDRQQLSITNKTIPGILCLIYRTILSLTPTEVVSGVTTPVAILNFVTSKLDPVFGDFNCSSSIINLK